MIELFEVGTRVFIGGKIEAIVTAVMIRAEQQIQYECVYWDSNVRKCEWVFSLEVRSEKDTVAIQIGFKK